MKTLFLLRHAKSSWSVPGLDDSERPLNKRGLKNAPTMGRRFKSRQETLDLVLTSPARRARTTAQLFVEACDLSPDIIIEEPELYFSGAHSIENIIISQDDRIQSIMLVFHNPDITHFANSIDVAHRIVNVPTCGLIKLASKIECWQDWSVANSEFLYFDYPKKLSN